ncbi:MAG TPA: cytochrome c [Microvirga sp.]|nr:cytochrome c [Microvirga sp.]
MSALRSRRALGVLCVIIIGGGVALVRAYQWRTENARAELGRRLYADRCASCHGTNLQGEPDWQTPKPNGRMPAPPHDASGHTWHHSDHELFQITKFGMAAVVPGDASDMPAFGGALSDREIHAVLAFIKSTWPEREREYQENRTKDAGRRQR